ncbi:MarR family transcriptional regulator [Alteromonadaceae bacterium M269]|nr:MarR family transcriptional regulator [Alteromonadaceae bacterium M269]
MMSFSKREMKLLLSIVHSRSKQSRKVFDKNDCCFQKSIRDTAEIVGSSKSTVGRLFKKLKAEGLIRDVIDSSNIERVMLHPDFIELNKSKYEKWFLLAMYYQGSDDKAQKYALQCRADGVLYDYKTYGEVVHLATGEITYGDEIRRLSEFEVKSWYKYIESYGASDRTKRREYYKL